MDHLAQLTVLTLAAGTPLVYAALGELVTEKSGVLNLGRRGHDARRRGHIVHRRGNHQVSVARGGSRHGGRRGVVAHLRRTHAVADGEPGGERTCTDAVRRWPVRVRRSQLRKRGHRSDHTAVRPLADGVATARKAVVRAQPARLPVARAVRIDPVVSVPYTCRPRPPRSGRVAAVGARDRHCT